MQQYDPKAIESKWQTYWDAEKTYQVENNTEKEKFYGLIEFPYPSGAGLHVGHPRPFTAMDVITRKKRMEGLNVLFPIGFDAFGLPTENFAIKTGRPPAEVTAENIANFTRQLKMLGLGFDWDRAVDTTDPKYYKWTQWIFLQLFKHGLAYKKNMPINWCINCKIGLANEEVVDGRCERCGGPVEKRDKEQWMLAITKYADSLLEGLNMVDYIPQAKAQQENWIGRSEGAEVNFTLRVPGQGEKHFVTVFTTRPDTLFGSTFLAISAELAKKWVGVGWAVSDDVKNYIEKTITERVSAREEEPEKTGIDAGITAINPATGKDIPVWITNYVLGDVGTGAIMAVPAHDERDFDFAKKFNLPIVDVVAPYVELTGICTPQEGKITTRKNVATAIIKKEQSDEYLLLEWQMGDFGFVGGGVEEGENTEDAIRREIVEETGYNTFTVEKVVLSSLFGHGFKPRKDKNCFDHDTVYLVTVDDSSVGELSEEDKASHNVHWIPFAQVATKVTLTHHQFMWDWYVKNKSCFSDDGLVINSDFLNDLTTAEAKEKMIAWLEEKGIGKKQVNFKLRDWVFSRQRYWGEPIPLVFCEHCAKEGKHENKGEEMNPGWIPMAETELPLTLPIVEKYEPTDTGESPLATMTEWVSVKCPRCGNDARRETDTMPNWAGSSWYFLRYADPNNDDALASKEALKYWTPVDWYNGGMEHTVLHLLYSRFWNQFLFDIGVVPTKEPYKKRTSHGMILAKGGEKMSKSKGNVVNPDEIVDQYGADTLRSYIMFMGPFDQAVEWDVNGLVGVRRFLDRVWTLSAKLGSASSEATDKLLHQTVKKVTEDIESMRFNTAIAKMMELLNALHKEETISKEQMSMLVRILSPFAPHMTEELWQDVLGMEGSVGRAAWPAFDTSKLVNDTFVLAVQVNGKLRGDIEVTSDISDDDAKAQALLHPNVVKWMEGKEPKKVIYVKGKLVSIVV